MTDASCYRLEKLGKYIQKGNLQDEKRVSKYWKLIID
jgi:hypothetical protein